jgi:hypothetical protein
MLKARFEYPVSFVNPRNIHSVASTRIQRAEHHAQDPRESDVKFTTLEGFRLQVAVVSTAQTVACTPG